MKDEVAELASEKKAMNVITEFGLTNEMALHAINHFWGYETIVAMLCDEIDKAGALDDFEEFIKANHGEPAGEFSSVVYDTNETDTTASSKCSPEIEYRPRQGRDAIKCHFPVDGCHCCDFNPTVVFTVKERELWVLAYHCLNEIFDFHAGVAQGCAVGGADCLYLSETWNRFDEILEVLIANTPVAKRDGVIADFEKLISECQKDVDAIEAEYRRQHEETYGSLEKSTGMEGAICDSSDTSPVDEKFFESLREMAADISPSESLRKEEGPETLASDEEFFECLRERSNQSGDKERFTKLRGLTGDAASVACDSPGTGTNNAMESMTTARR